jgi:hypothetical protein
LLGLLLSENFDQYEISMTKKLLQRISRGKKEVTNLGKHGDEILLGHFFWFIHSLKQSLFSQAGLNSALEQLNVD